MFHFVQALKFSSFVKKATHIFYLYLANSNKQINKLEMLELESRKLCSLTGKVVIYRIAVFEQ